jgi:hypothetical protein
MRGPNRGPLLLKCGLTRLPDRRSFCPQRFPKLIHRQHFAGVAGMFLLHPFLEKRYVRLAIRGQGAEHFIGARASFCRTQHALRLLRLLQRANFSLKLLMAEHIGAESFWHPLTLPQNPAFQKAFLSNAIVKFCIPYRQFQPLTGET